uniref:Uncharacterized protein n=1 Tax=Anguilla anguilla TaxID=7936 RepID=A0A0E9UQP0_ANGAN
MTPDSILSRSRFKSMGCVSQSLLSATCVVRYPLNSSFSSRAVSQRLLS